MAKKKAKRPAQSKIAGTFDETDAETEKETNGYTEREQRHYRSIQDVNRRVIAAQIIWAEKNESAKAAKKGYDGLVISLQELIARGPDPQSILPGMDGDDDSWQDTAIAVALEDLAGRQLEALSSAGISTMGELEQLRAGEGLTSVDGIGEKIAEKIEEQILGWLAGWQAGSA